jgi:hypothetical protein
MAWKDVKRFAFCGQFVELHSADNIMKVYLGLCGSSEQIIEEIMKRIPQSALQEYQDSFKVTNLPFDEHEPE